VLLCVVLALLTSASNATAAVLQRRAASQASSSKSMHLSLIAELARRKVWLAGIGMVIVAALFQAGALATGPVALVQPIFIIELPLALLLGSFVMRRQIPRRIWIAVAAVTVGLGPPVRPPDGARRHRRARARLQRQDAAGEWADEGTPWSLLGSSPADRLRGGPWP